MISDVTNQDIKTGWLIDGTGAPAYANTVLRIRNGRIESVNSSFDDAKSAEGNISGTIDLSSCTIIPGLIDAHVHLGMSGTTDITKRAMQLVAGYEEIEAIISRHIEDHLHHGIIAVRDGGDHDGHVLRYKKSIRKQNPTPVIMKIAGKAWYRKGRYGKLTGNSVPDGCSLAESIKKRTGGPDNPDNPDNPGNPDNITKIDHIKVINSGLNSLNDFGKQTFPQFDTNELEEAVFEGGKLGLKTMVHANGELPVKVSIDSGCHSIEHGFFMGIFNLKKMTEKRIVWIPTAYTMRAYADLSDSDTSQHVVSLQNLEHQIEQIRVARNFGVKVGLGTDSGSPGVHHGASLSHELRILMEAGYSVEEAIQCATSTNSELLGLNDLGQLTEGRRATFIVVKGRPSDLPDSLENIESVYTDGRLV